ncbi:hypothetical protein [Kutzneria sp. NPDC052558]|uniref:hypothetical protein n=1 Tax=Kutzneria sp. NPDC052558 TaxID=3364121 RepID=UPI0037C836B2
MAINYRNHVRLGLWRWWARPAGYGPLARWSDARAGRRDGRGRVVDALDTAAGPGRSTVTTPRVKALISRAEQGQDREKIRFLKLWTELQRVRVRYAGPAEAQQERVAMAERELARLDGEVDTSLFGHLTDERYPREFVERRRRRLIESRRAEVAERYVLEKELLIRLEQRVTAVDFAIAALNDVAQIRVRQAHALGQRRIFAYWAELIITHPEGAVVNARLLPALPALPVWNGPQSENGNNELPA